MAKWQEQAEALFFMEHLKINTIAEKLNKSRKTISAYLNSCVGYSGEMLYRKQQNTAKRKEYKKEWDRNNRKAAEDNESDSDMLRRCHREAVLVLSHEKY